LATADTTPITTTGSSAMIGLRKMISSSRRMRTIVPAATTASALPDASRWSKACATLPVVSRRSPVPRARSRNCARSGFTESSSAFWLALVRSGICTPMVCTRWLGDGGPATTRCTFGSLFAVSALATPATVRESEAESGAPSAREATITTEGVKAAGKARSWSASARIDS
jgi:hypothetical protein